MQVNCVLLGEIARCLCTKFRSSPDHFKTALKAVLFLIPVFGVHYIFYVSKQAIAEDCLLFHETLIYVGVGVDSLQGAIVATIFCLLNAEVSCQADRAILHECIVTGARVDQTILPQIFRFSRLSRDRGSRSVSLYESVRVTPLRLAARPSPQPLLSHSQSQSRSASQPQPQPHSHPRRSPFKSLL